MIGGPFTRWLVVVLTAALVSSGGGAGRAPTSALAAAAPSPSGPISVSAELLDWGEVEMGAPEVILRVAVRNETDRAMGVSTRDPIGSQDFRVTRFVNLTLSAGQTVYLDMAFRPLSVGRKAGSVRLVWPDGFAEIKLQAQVREAVIPTAPPPDPIPTPDPTPVRVPISAPVATPVPVVIPDSGYFVSPAGRPGAAGTQDDPWDLDSAVNGTHRAKLASGGTVWLLPGTYRKSPNREGLGFRCVVGGSAERPLVFRAVPGSRVTIDGGFSFFAGSSHVWLWGVEVLVSEEKPRNTSGSWPPGAPSGGVNFYASYAAKAINCVLHDNRQGASVWLEAQDAEVYGCLIYDNGWVGIDRAHGHGIYVQNPETTTKRLIDNVFSARHSKQWPSGRYTMHGYGDRVQVTNITAEGNMQAGVSDAWLLGFGDPPGGSNRVLNNTIHGVRVRVGSRVSQPLEFRGNIIASGQLEISRGPEVAQSENLIAPPQPRPQSPSAILRPNQYEPERAHLMLIDWQRRGRVRLDLAGYAAPGQGLRVLDATDVYGPPVWAGAVPEGGIELDVPEGARVFVLVKERLPGAEPIAPR